MMEVPESLIRVPGGSFNGPHSRELARLATSTPLAISHLGAQLELQTLLLQRPLECTAHLAILQGAVIGGAWNWRPFCNTCSATQFSVIMHSQPPFVGMRPERTMVGTMWSRNSTTVTSAPRRAHTAVDLMSGQLCQQGAKLRIPLTVNPHNVCSSPPDPSSRPM